MINTNDLAPFAGTVGGGFLIGFVTGHAIKKVIKLENNKQAQTSRMAIDLMRHVPANILFTVMGGLMDTLPHGII
jgi:hypothetical protein